MATYYVDPSVSASGDGLSQATAFKYVGNLPTTGGHTFRLRADGLKHRPSATIPTNLTAANTALAMGASSSNVTFETYGSGNAVITGAVLWGGSVGSEVVNGQVCKTLLHTAEVSPYWYPRSGALPSYPCLCAPTSDDSVDSFMVNPAAFDDIAPGAAGVRYLPASSYGNGPPPSNTLLDDTKEVSFTDTGSASNTQYRVKIIRPGFWARANAVDPLVGHRIVLRNGANFTDFYAKILSYDAVEGSVIVGTAAPPNGGTTGNFFYALVGHKYGLRLRRQYAMIMDAGVPKGWITSLPDGEIDVACYSTGVLYVGDNLTFDAAKTWTFEAFAHGNELTNGTGSITRAGCGICLSSGVTGVTVGPLIGRGIRSVGRSGAVLNGSGSGVMTNVNAASISMFECMGIKAYELAPSTTTGGNSHVVGPVYSEEGAGSVRYAGGGSGYSLKDLVVAPRASIHDNGINIYQEALDVLLEGVCVVGAVNPYATQYNAFASGSLPPPASVNRRVVNAWFSGRPKIDLSGYETASIMRHDNGNTAGLYDRCFSVNGGANSYGTNAGNKPNTDMVVQRSVLENVGRSAPTDGQTFAGMTYRYNVFVHKPAAAAAYPSTMAYIQAFGGTVENCVELPDLFSGVMTDDMWRVLTLNDTFDGYEDVSPWLAPQLGLTLKAYGSTRTLVAPAFVHVPFRAGHQAGMMYGAFINPNPLSTMSLPVGAGDNGKLEPVLFGGVNVIPKVNCPDQSTFEIVLRVSDAGATNGPYQDFTYLIDVQSFADGTQYGPFTLTVTDALSTTRALPDFYITVAA